MSYPTNHGYGFTQQSVGYPAVGQPQPHPASSGMHSLPNNSLYDTAYAYNQPVQTCQMYPSYPVPMQPQVVPTNYPVSCHFVQHHTYPSYPSQAPTAYPGMGQGSSYPVYPPGPTAHTYPPQVSDPNHKASGSHCLQPQGTALYPPYNTMNASASAINKQFSSHPSEQRRKEQMVATVFPASPFDCRLDAERLHDAMKGFGSNKEAIINILCRRSCHQRVDIVQHYKSMYGKDLKQRLISELTGNLEAVMVALTQPVHEFLAHELHHAIKGLGTHEHRLIEILCPASNHDLRSICAAYQKAHGRSLESDVHGDTSGHFRRILVAIIQAQRDEGTAVNQQLVGDDAQRLFAAGEGRWGTEESVFINLLATRSWEHLRLLQVEYMKISPNSLEKAVRKEFSGCVEKALLAILKSASNRHAFYANCLHDAMVGLGTRDRDLIRLIVAHCDTDLGSIKCEYQHSYLKDLSVAVASETSGDYKKALLTLIG